MRVTQAAETLIGAIDGKRVSAISVRQLEAAARAARAGGPAGGSGAAQHAARPAGASLRRGGERQVRAAAVRGDGGWIVRIEVPQDAVERVVGGRR